ncbi:MAG: ABC transporter permease [Sphingobium sp. 66-54]|nr:MAG: ABC transporter permease [Sphingobium sp. 66-54]
MGRYILKRLWRALITLIVISMLIFVIARVTGDPIAYLAPEDASEQELAQVRARLGLDKPIYVQYAFYVGDALRGDFGNSLRYNRPAFEMVLQRLPATIQLSLIAFIVSTILGIMMGVLAALRRDTWIDGALRLLAVLGQSAPSFWIGILAIMIFGVHLQWLPTSGRMGPEYLILPSLTLALFSMASVMRLTRSAMLETQTQEYVKFLRAKGVPESQIIFKHMLRNALVPVLAVLGIQLSHLVGGTVIIEIVFNWPGVGRLMVEALLNSDLPLIQAGVMLIAISVVLVNLLVDLSYGLVDPRIRIE